VPYRFKYLPRFRYFCRNTSLSGREVSVLSTSVGWRALQSFAPEPAQTSPWLSSCVSELQFALRFAAHQPTLADNIRLYCTQLVKPVLPTMRRRIRLGLGRRTNTCCARLSYESAHWGCFRWIASRGKTGAGWAKEYVPFEFLIEHLTPSFDFPEARPYYSLRQKPRHCSDGSMDTYLKLWPALAWEQHETLSVELTCTQSENRHCQLPLGAILSPQEGTPGNILRFFGKHQRRDRQLCTTAAAGFSLGN